MRKFGLFLVLPSSQPFLSRFTYPSGPLNFRAASMSFPISWGPLSLIKRPWLYISRVRRQLKNFIIYMYFIRPKGPFWWTIFKNGNKKFHRTLLFPKNAKVQITPKRPRPPGKIMKNSATLLTSYATMRWILGLLFCILVKGLFVFCKM